MTLPAMADTIDTFVQTDSATHHNHTCRLRIGRLHVADTGFSSPREMKHEQHQAEEQQFIFEYSWCPSSLAVPSMAFHSCHLLTRIHPKFSGSSQSTSARLPKAQGPNAGWGRSTMDSLEMDELRKAVISEKVSDVMGYIEKAKLNVNQKFEMNDERPRGTVLQHACFYQCEKLLATLIKEAKADWSVTTEDGNTTAHLACFIHGMSVKKLWDSVESVLLMEYQSEGMKDAQKKVDAVRKKFLNKRNNAGETCLHHAAFRGNSELVAYLIKDVQVDWNSTTNDGNTAGHYACRYGNPGLMKKLSESVEWVLRNRYDYEELGTDDVEKAVGAEKKQLLDKQNNKGETCLHVVLQNPEAASGDMDDDIAWLLENNADGGIVNNDGKPPWEVYRTSRELVVMFNALSWFFLRNAEQAATSGEQPEWFRNTNVDKSDWNKWDHVENRWHLLMYFEIRGRFPFLNWWFYVPVNKRSSFWALLQKLSSTQEDPDVRGIFKILLSDEVQEALAPYEIENSRVREPLCTWDSFGLSKKDISAEKDHPTENPGPAKEEDPSSEGDSSEQDSSNEEMLSLVMPYFYSEDAGVYSDEPAAVKERRARSAQAASSSYHIRGSEVTDLYPPVTLDEYCKPGLSQDTLDELNRDQMLTRAGMPRLLMVQQVWLWKIGKVVITAFPREVYNSKTMFNESLKEISNLDDPFIGIGSLLSQLVDIINRPAMAGLSEPILNTFENEIVKVASDLKKYVNNPEDTKVKDIKVAEESDFYHRILDIREELGMIKMVILQQENIWREFTGGVWPKYWSGGGNRESIAPDNDRGKAEDRRHINRIARTQGHIEQLKTRIQQLDEDARRVRDRIGIQLDLKTKQATLKEAHATAIMSAAVFGFSLITIVFTPLGFVISLFQLPIEGFKTNGDGDYSGGYIGGWLTFTEIIVLALTLVAMWAAVRYGLESNVRDLFTKGPKDPSPASDSDDPAADDKKSSKTQHEGRKDRPIVEAPTPTPLPAQPRDSNDMV